MRAWTLVRRLAASCEVKADLLCFKSKSVQRGIYECSVSQMVDSADNQLASSQLLNHSALQCL